MDFVHFEGVFTEGGKYLPRVRLVFNVRNLEKIEGFWKLTYIGGVIYKRD
jgi:hypothetical protein